jgi:hypothetical protein
MPVKRRLGPAAEVEAWSEIFQCGYDFFGDLEPLGFKGGDADRAARAAAPEAWARLGALCLETHADRKPWALEKFGQPRGYRASDD